MKFTLQNIIDLKIHNNQFWILLLFCLVGCSKQITTTTHVLIPSQGTQNVSTQAPPPDALKFKVINSKDIVELPGSAAVGNAFIESEIEYSNTSNQPVWVTGNSKTSLFFGYETRISDSASWQEYFIGYCGFGAKSFEIVPGDSHRFFVSFPEEFRGQQFRVIIDYSASETGSISVESKSDAILLK